MSDTPIKDYGGSVDKRRSQRVLLKIQIMVSAQFEDGLPIKEDSTTLEVNAHGALMN